MREGEGEGDVNEYLSKDVSDLIDDWKPEENPTLTNQPTNQPTN